MGFFWNAPKGGKSRAHKFGLNDIVFGSNRGDEIDTGMGFDLVFARGGDDTVRLGQSGIVFAGWGDDTIFGGSGSLRAFGGFGDDTVHLAEGENYIDGGRGFDTAVISGSITDYSFAARGRHTTILTSPQAATC